MTTPFKANTEHKSLHIYPKEKTSRTTVIENNTTHCTFDTCPLLSPLGFTVN
jgi:hypothetical protein